MIHLEKYFEIRSPTLWRNAREFNISLILVFKYLTLSNQYTALLCDGVTERTVTDVSVVIYIIALYRSRGVRKRSVCVHVYVRACVCVCCTVNEIRRRRKWNNRVKRSVWQWALPLSVGGNRVKSMTWRDHAPLRLASLFADSSFCSTATLFVQTKLVNRKEFPVRQIVRCDFTFGKSYMQRLWHRCYTKALESFFQNIVCTIFEKKKTVLLKYLKI